MSTFRFQQFAVRQNDSAMKVCTDATLFGAMAPLRGGEQVLDIGTGTGLLALMAMQLGAARVTGVELTGQAFAEARYNFAQSPWAEHLSAVHASIQDFCRGRPDRFDLIICNPPFFDNHSKGADPLRNQARHAESLPYDILVACLDRLTTGQGRCHLLLPCHALGRFTGLAVQHGLHLTDRTDIRGHAHSRAKVSALTFSRRPGTFSTRVMTIYQADGVYSTQSTPYLSPFLLRFAQNHGVSPCLNRSASV